MRCGNVHLTYCTNIHPAETWAQTRAVLEGPVQRVKALLGSDADFGIGLRLSGQAAAGLRAEGAASWRQRLADAGCYVFTINGFPHGRFHGAPIKADVYRPDWREAGRSEYTSDLIAVLAELLHPGLEGSISTVPGCFRSLADDKAKDAVARRLLSTLPSLVTLSRARGISIALALEPEPACMLETTGEVVSFFETHLLSAEAVKWTATATGLSASAAEIAIRHHLGVCLDVCHAAVAFEGPRKCVDDLVGAGLRIVKTQATAGLRMSTVDEANVTAIEAFADDVYLHQTVTRRGDALNHYVDLPEAIAAFRRNEAADEWRVHFHVPVFEAHPAPFEGTQDFLEACLPAAIAAECRHVEVETYTWDVLPQAMRRKPLEEAIVREIIWTREHLQ